MVRVRHSLKAIFSFILLTALSVRVGHTQSKTTKPNKAVVPKFDIALSPRLVLPIGHYYGILKICKTDDEKNFATADEKGKVLIWESQDVTEVGRFRIGKNIDEIEFINNDELVVFERDQITVINIKSTLHDTMAFEGVILKCAKWNKELLILKDNGQLFKLELKEKRVSLLAEKVKDFDVHGKNIFILKEDEIVNNWEPNKTSSLFDVPFLKIQYFVKTNENGSFLFVDSNGVILKFNYLNSAMDTVDVLGAHVKSYKFDTLSNSFLVCTDEDFGFHQYAIDGDYNAKSSLHWNDYCMDVEVIQGEKYVVSYDGSIRIVSDDFSEGRVVGTKIKKPTTYCFLNNDQVAIGTSVGSVYIYDIATASKEYLFEIDGLVSNLSYNKLNKNLYAAGFDGSISVFNLQSRKIINERRFPVFVKSAALCNNGNIVVVGHDTLYLLDAALNNSKAVPTNAPMYLSESKSSSELLLAARNQFYIIDEDSFKIVKVNESNFDIKRFSEVVKFPFYNSEQYFMATMDGELWEYKNKSSKLLRRCNFKIYHFYLSLIDSCFYLVNYLNEIYRWDPEKYMDLQLVYKAENMKEEETWCISENSIGNKLVTCGKEILVFDKSFKIKIASIKAASLLCMATDSRRSASFLTDSIIFAMAYDGELICRNWHNGQDFNNMIEKRAVEKRFNLVLDSLIKRESHYNLWKDSQVVRYLDLDNKEWIVYDRDRRFDGSENAINHLYVVCGLEKVHLKQLKDSLWVPGLAEKTLNGKPIMINDKPAPKLSDLNICELTPLVETNNLTTNKLRYRITPRRGGLGNADVIINGNITYTYSPNQLERRIENEKEVYYLNLDTDTLQDYLTATMGATNPIQVTAAVKGSGIYGRGKSFELVKSTGTGERPKFYGVFVGVNDYGNPQGANNANHYRDLTFAQKDASDMADAVEACARNLFDKDSCFIYRLAGKDNMAPTKDNLQRVLGEIGKKARASDVLYIFFAGHGDLLEADGSKQIRFLLQNAEKRNVKSGSFGTEDLTDWCHPRKIKAQKRVFVFDACHSGQFLNETYAAVQGRGDDEGNRIRQLDKLKDKNGMMILAAAAENESAYEDETLNQGVLTYHLLQTLKVQAEDTSLTIKSWFDQTIKEVQEYSKENGQQQEPRSFGDGLFEIGNISKKVRDNIKIECPKKRVGHCIFTSNAKTRALFPSVEDTINGYFSLAAKNRKLVYSKKSNRSYQAIGYYVLENNKIEIGYDLYLGDKKEKANIQLPTRKYKSQSDLIKDLLNSIEMEIEILDAAWRLKNCDLSK